MEFEKGPLPVTPEYTREVAKILKVSRVNGSGLFDRTGTFSVVTLEQNLGKHKELSLNNNTPMWALDLLEFTEADDGVRATKDGSLFVYHRRTTKNIRNNIQGVHNIALDNVRIVDGWTSFTAKVGESGWVLDNQTAWRQRRPVDGSIPNERLEEILADAEAGKKPSFFNDTEFVKVELRLVGRKVEVIRFADVNDFVVVDIESRQLVGRYAQKFLSRGRWTANSVVAKS